MLVDRFCIGLSFGNFCLFTIFFTLEALQLTTIHLDIFKLSSKSSLVPHMPVSALDFAQVSLKFIKYFNFGLQISTRLFKSVQLVKLTFPSSNYTDLTYKVFFWFKPFGSRVCPSIRHDRLFSLICCFWSKQQPSSQS